MSLIAWYPLNGDTKDYSGNNFHLTNNGATVDTSGKIGSCYLTNHVNNKYLNVEAPAIKSTFANGNDFTVCFWQKVDSLRDRSMYISYGSELTNNKMLHIGIRSANVVGMGFGGNDLDADFSFSVNKWYHITAVYQKEYQKIYVNGQLIKSKKTYSHLNANGKFHIGTVPTQNTANINSFYNDVRIYNEALTAKQIKEISQAKICHYTFNEEMYENTINLYNNKNQLSPHWTKIEWENTYALSFEIAKDSYYNGIFFTTNLTLKPLTTYTLSYKFKKLAGNLKQIRGHIGNNFEALGGKINGVEFPTLVAYHQGISVVDCDDEYVIEVIFRTRENVTNMNDIYIQPNATVSDYVKVKIWDIQVEEKDHSTPFTPNSRTQELKDISGYGHHMTTYNQYSPIWKQDSDIKIKGYTTLSDKASYYCENFRYKYPDAFTFSCWVKTTDNEAFCLIGFPSGDNTYISLCMYDNAKISMHSYFSSPNSNSNKWYASSKTAINDNKWHLVTITYNGTTVKSYVDGIFESSSNITFDFEREPMKNLSINLLNPTFNFEDYEARRFFNGDITDVRIYATALSDEDVKLLYQPEINIDKSNVIRCSEINEKEMEISESIKIVSTGYGANQGRYKVSIGDKYSTTETAVGWCVTSIDIDKNIIHRTFRTHLDCNVFETLKQYVDSLPIASTILLSTYDQPSVHTFAANNDERCKNWIDYLRNLGATQIDGSFIHRASYAAIIQERKIVAEGIHNTNTDSMVTLEKIVNLKVNKQGFNNNASITYNEFNEVPNIKSGVHNLRLGNEILPVLIDMDKDGGRWARVFYHNCRSGTVLFSGDNSYAEAKETNKNAPTTSDKYSILSKLEHFRPNTKSAFEFRLKYPTDTNDCNIWKQTSNPTYEAVSGYVPINIHWTFNLWGGLEYNGRSAYTFIDGSVNNSGWYYAIGAASKQGNGIPSSTNISPNGSTANNVELWVRINNYDLFADNLISNVSISRDGVLTAKEFREI